jgi:hypothetical protein
MSDGNTVRKWVSDQALSEAGIRAKYPSEKYRVSVQRYPARARTDGVTRAALCHVVSGAAEYEFEGGVELLEAGEIAELPGGRYRLEVVGDEELVVIMCWELPFSVNRVQ